MDEAARERERSAADDAQRAEVLRGRLRSGELSKRSLGRAAALGYAPARIALGLEDPPRTDWIGILHSLPLSGVVRAALCALRARDGQECGPGWEAAATWARDPRPKHHASARAEFERARVRPEELALLAGVVRTDVTRLRQLIEDAERDVPDLYERVQNELVPWLLGEGDPLSD